MIQDKLQCPLTAVHRQQCCCKFRQAPVQPKKKSNRKQLFDALFKLWTVIATRKTAQLFSVIVLSRGRFAGWSFGDIAKPTTLLALKEVTSRDKEHILLFRNPLYRVYGKSLTNAPCRIQIPHS